MVVGILIALALCLLWPVGLMLEIILSPRVDPNSAQGRASLVRLARETQPLLAAISAYEKGHGTVPQRLGDAESYMTAVVRQDVAGNSWRGWAYSAVPGVDPHRYELSRLLGRDPFLDCRYDSGRLDWAYDPGDGTARTELAVAGP
jgi:hypothetical protein